MNQRSNEDFKTILIERCRFLFAIALTYLIDAAYLLGWLGIHTALKRAVEWFDPVGYERIVGYLLKVIFEVPALVLLVVFVVVDTKKIIGRITHGVDKNSATIFPDDGKENRQLGGTN